MERCSELNILFLISTSCISLHHGSVLLSDNCNNRQTCETKICNSCKKNDKPFPEGDPRNCLLQQPDLLKMEIPGTGWDNLRNLDMDVVMSESYSQCKTTKDGIYLIPDSTYALALKESNVDLTSEYFEHWNNYTSTTSTSMNVAAHSVIEEGAFGGSFSAEFRSVKNNQIRNKAVTTRVQLRHTFYTIKSRTVELNPLFKTKLLDIASRIQLNNTKMARYLTDLIVRDYGTHYITSLDIGAVLSKVDHIKSSYAQKEDMDISKITISASADFGLWGASTSVTHFSSTDNIKGYQQSITASSIKAYGGPPFGANFTVKDWEAELRNNLVPIDRLGDPLYYVIEPEVFPELPDQLVFEVTSYLKHAIKSYYHHNIIRGCTNPNSRDFNIQAILDDHSCEKPYTNFTFGGVFQRCDVTSR